MRKLFFIALCLCFSTASIAKPVLDIHTWKTSNGVNVFFVRAAQVPMLDAAVIFKAGSIYDAGKYGLATLTNAMLNEGAGQYNVDQLANNFNNVGAIFGNFTDKETSVFSLRTLVQAKYLQPAIKTFTTILSKPTFPQASLQRIKREMLIGLQAAEQQPGYIAGRAYAKAIWGAHPYAFPTEGNAQTIPNLTQAQVAAFYNQYYIAQNATVVMVGDLTQVQAHVIASQIAGNLPLGIPAHAPQEATENAAASINLPFPSTQNTILIGTLGIKRNSPKLLPLQVGNYILGGGGNLGSILMSNVREKYGLTYGVSSNFAPLTDKGTFTISLKTRNDQAERASNMVQDYLANFIASGPTTAQLKAAKNYLLGSFPLKLSNNGQILGVVMQIAYYHLPLDYLDTYQQRLKAITKQQIKTAFADTVDLKNLVVVSVGGKDKK